MTAPFRYSAYQLAIESDFALSELPAGGPGPVNLVVARTPVPGASKDRSVEFADYGDRQLLAWETVGSFLVAGDDRIEVEPNEGVADELVALPLLGSVLATLLHRRGLFVLHASAVSVHGQAVGLLGDKGAGKSTTAAALINAGHRLIADDILAIDFSDPGRLMVLPGFGQLKLWRDSAERVGGAVQKVRQLHPAIDKASYAVADSFVGSPVPLSRLYVLDRSGQAAIEPIPPAAAVSTLLQFSYMGRFGHAGFGARLGEHFQRSAQLAAAGIVRRIAIPDGLDRVGAVAPTIEADLDASALPPRG